jgi:predicted histone-like DNA-binding protein
MSLIYHRILRGSLKDPEAPKKWYVVLKRIGMIREKEIAKELADETTLNPMEAAMAVYLFKKVLIAKLLSGYSVQLGEVGSFYLNVNSEGADTKEEATAEKVTRVNVRFYPGKELKAAIRKAHFIPYERLLGKHGNTTSTGTGTPRP